MHALLPTASVTDERPFPPATAAGAELRSVAHTATLLRRHRLRHVPDRRGTTFSFADGTHARLFRETVVPDARPREPAVLVVMFRLRAVRGLGHAAFRRESLLNTPLFAGFPGFVSKLWIAHDGQDRYRCIYQWDGAGLADYYARCLWRVLAIGCAPGSIRHRVVPAMTRDLFLDGAVGAPGAWWAVTATVPRPTP